MTRSRTTLFLILFFVSFFGGVKSAYAATTVTFSPATTIDTKVAVSIDCKDVSCLNPIALGYNVDAPLNTGSRWQHMVNVTISYANPNTTYYVATIDLGSLSQGTHQFYMALETMTWVGNPDFYIADTYWNPFSFRVISPYAVNGVCGPANGQYYTSQPPTSSLCSSGTPGNLFKLSSTFYIWSCFGSNGGTSASCQTSMFPPTCSNGANNYPTCNTCTAPQVYNGSFCTNPCTNGGTNPPWCTTCPSGKLLSGGQCITPTVSVVASPSTYSVAGGTSNPFTFSATANPSNSYACRLLDYQQSPLTSYVNGNSSISYAVPTNAGTYSYYLGCENTADTGTTAVSNQITVTVLPPTSVTFSAAPSVLYGAGATVLTWSSSPDTTYCTSPDFSTGNAADNMNPGVSVNVSSAGSPYTFHITCYGPGGPTSKVASVVVNSAPSATLSLGAQSLVRSGQSATLSWSVVNMTANSCHISTVGTPWSATIGNASNDSGKISSPPIDAPTVVTLTCTGLDGKTTSQQKKLNLVPSAGEI